MILLSLFSFQLKKTSLALFLLFIASITLGIFIAKLDPFINLWDEQFHALVAKNLISHPFIPTLIKDPVFNITNPHWTYSQIWLHKQPLFLWQMALSMKLFGENEIAIRLPSVLMHAILLFFIFRIGKIFFSDKVGYYTAVFFTCAYFPLEYITGFYATDHNDISFLFYCFASIWALTEYYESKKNIYLILIGLFAGAAILCKWLIGLLVYGIWFILAYSNRKQISFYKEILKLLGSLIICVLIFLPWQLYTSLIYPTEFANEMAFNSKHIYEPLESHGGNYLFYYDALYEQFGEGFVIPPLILICFISMFFFIKNKNHGLILIVSSVMLYLFFTFVKTKMYGYVFVLFPFFILGLAFAYNSFIEKINLKIKNQYFKKIINISTVVLVLFFLFNPGKIYKHHSNLEKGRYKSRLIKVREKQFFIELKKYFGNKKCLIINCKTSLESNIIATFYTNYPSFNYILNKEQIALAKKLNFRLISINDGHLPEYITGDKSIMKIEFNPI